MKLDFIIVGAAKAGTTSNYYYLRQHPEITMSSLKEPFFFAYMDEDTISFNSGDNPKIITSAQEYNQLFAVTDSYQKVGEASTWYLYLHDKVIKNIKKYCKDSEPKIVIFLRNPIDRCWSHYQMNVANGWEDSSLTFEDVIQSETIAERMSSNWAPTYDYIGFGNYYNQVKAYLNNFQRVKIVFLVDFLKNKQVFFNNLFDFLGVDTTFIPDTTIRYNFSGKPKNKLVNYILFEDNPLKKILRPLIDQMNQVKFIDNLILRIRSQNNQKIEMSQNTKSLLISIYKDDISKLEDLLKKDLSHWLNY